MPPPPRRAARGGQANLLTSLPDDLLGHVWSFLDTSSQRNLLQTLPSMKGCRAILSQIRRLQISARAFGFSAESRGLAMYSRLDKFPPGASLQELSLVDGYNPKHLMAFAKHSCLKKRALLAQVKTLELEGWQFNAVPGCDCGLCEPGQPDYNFEVSCVLSCTTPQLKCLKLQRVGFNKHFLSTPMFQSIRCLMVTGECGFEGMEPVNGAIQSISQLTQLQDLRLMLADEDESHVSLRPLSSLQQLQTLHVDTFMCMETTGAADVLRSCSKLTCLELVHEGLSVVVAPAKQDGSRPELPAFSQSQGTASPSTNLQLNITHIDLTVLPALLDLPVIRSGNVHLASPIFLNLVCDEDGHTVPPVHELSLALEDSAHKLQAMMPRGEEADRCVEQTIGFDKALNRTKLFPYLSISRDMLAQDDGFMFKLPRVWLTALSPMNSGLRMLALDGLQLCREDVSAIASALPQLWLLKILDSHIASGCVTRIVSQLCHLRRLAIEYGTADVGDVKEACHIAQASHVPWRLELRLWNVQREPGAYGKDSCLPAIEGVRAKSRLDLVQNPLPTPQLRRSQRLKQH